MPSIPSSDPPEASPTQSDDSRQPSLDPQTAAMLGMGGSQSRNMKSAMEIVSGSFPPFDNRTKIIEPFLAEQVRDAVFRKAVCPQEPGSQTHTTMSSNAHHCSFVLLAEFDIDRGAQLTYQFPQPLGTDEGLLANLMLPDGAEKQLEDWTIFFLNQTPFNTIAPVLALESDGEGRDVEGQDVNRSELLYVLNLVRTKHDKTVRRGAVVKAMAICTRHPFVEIFKPVLLLALDDYFNAPSQDCLARLFDAINAMDISAAPVLTRYEKLIMRHSERKDVFAEKFLPPRPSPDASTPGPRAHRNTASNGSHSSFEE
ncbi:hypothetical protein EWM64_g10052, partial [Hericium alpestre]